MSWPRQENFDPSMRSIRYLRAFEVVASEFSDEKTEQGGRVVSVEHRYKGGCTSTAAKYGRRTAGWIREQLPMVSPSVCLVQEISLLLGYFWVSSRLSAPANRRITE